MKCSAVKGGVLVSEAGLPQVSCTHLAAAAPLQGWALSIKARHDLFTGVMLSQEL